MQKAARHAPHHSKGRTRLLAPRIMKLLFRDLACLHIRRDLGALLRIHCRRAVIKRGHCLKHSKTVVSDRQQPNRSSPSASRTANATRRANASEEMRLRPHLRSCLACKLLGRLSRQRCVRALLLQQLPRPRVLLSHVFHARHLVALGPGWASTGPASTDPLASGDRCQLEPSCVNLGSVV